VGNIYHITKARIIDSLFVYQLRTDKRDRGSYLTRVTSFEEHQNFWERNYHNYMILWLNNKRVAYFGLVNGDFRLAILREYRGLGIGKFIVEEAKTLIGSNPILITEENKASYNLFVGQGFVVTESTPTHKVLINSEYLHQNR